MNERIYNIIMRVILAGMIFGMLGMIQPFSLAIFKPAFLVLFYCTLGYIVFSHVTPKPAKVAENKIAPSTGTLKRESGSVDGK